MWDQGYDFLPNSLARLFDPVSQVHGHNSRMVSGELAENISR